MAVTGRRPGFQAGRVVARNPETVASADANNAAQLRTRLVGDRRVDGCTAGAGARRSGNAAAGTLRRVLYGRWMVGQPRHVRCPPSADLARVWNERRRTPGSAWRSGAPSSGAPTRLQEPEIC